MFYEEFQLGGPVMWLLFGVWVIMGALLLERTFFWVLRPLTRPTAVPAGSTARSRFLESVEYEAKRNGDRIDTLAQLATSVGLKIPTSRGKQTVWRGSIPAISSASISWRTHI